MSTMPKHLRDMDNETRAALQTGYNRFRLGFADPGERLAGAVFVGNYRRKKDAVAARDDCGGHLNPYLHGKLLRGWAVWKKETAGGEA